MSNENKPETIAAETVRRAATMLHLYVAAIGDGITRAQARGTTVANLGELPVELPARLSNPEEFPDQILMKHCAGQVWHPRGKTVKLSQALDDIGKLSEIVRVGLSGVPRDERWPIAPAAMGGTG